MVTRSPRWCCNSLSDALVKSTGVRVACTARGTEARCAQPVAAKSIANEIARRVFMQPNVGVDLTRQLHPTFDSIDQVGKRGVGRVEAVTISLCDSISPVRDRCARTSSRARALFISITS